MTGVAPTRLRRLPTFSYVGPYRYSLTLCAFERQSLFVDAALVEVLTSQVLRAAPLCAFQVIAYCFMPDHVHALVEGSTDSAKLVDFVQRAKQLSGYHGKRLAGGPIWQTGYFERVLRNEEDTRTVAAYILANPVRAGLVKNPGEYRFSGSENYSLAELLEFVANCSDRPS